jgi:YbbR domain-containing protein
MGPKGSVELITSIETSEHVFESARNDFSQTVVLVYPEVYSLKIEPDTVRVFVTVEPIKRKDYGNISIRLVNFPVGVNYSVSPETVNLRLSGTTAAIDDLRPEQIAVMADYVLIDNSGKIPVQVILPEGVKVISQSTDSIVFKLK